jgi:hypothetical protein
VPDGRDAQPEGAGRGASQREPRRAAACRAGGLTGVRLQLIAAALDLGLLDALGEGPASTEQLAGRLGAVDQELLAAYLRVLAAAGLITGEGTWRLTRFGRAVLGDDVVRATYEGFGGYHTELYRDLPRCCAAARAGATPRSRAR